MIRRPPVSTRSATLFPYPPLFLSTRGKAIIVLNPAEPPLIMRDTVYCLCDDADRDAITKSIEAMVAEVQTYVPGYRLKQAVQFESIGSNAPLRIPEKIGRAHV